MSQEGGFFGYSSGSGNGFTQAKPREYSVRSLTIKQIAGAQEPSPDASSEIDGAPVHLARLVAIVREIRTEESHIQLRLQDSTGDLTAKQWRATTDSETEPPYQLGDYVAAYGTLRTYSSQRYFNVTKIEPNVSLAFVFYHQMAVLQEHLHYTGKQLLTADANPPAPVKQEDSTKNLFVDDAPAEAQNTLSSRILSALQGHQDGLHVKYLAQHLNAEEFELRQEFLKLLDSGLVFEAETDMYAPT